VDSAYPDLVIPESTGKRPYLAINMIATLDGKILSGERDEHVMDLGSKFDHATMRTIEAAFDAVIIGAGSLRATPGLWYAPDLRRYVVTRTGNVDYSSRFFADVPEKAVVVTPEAGRVSWPQTIVLTSWIETLEQIRNEGVRRLLCEGGSNLNAQLFAEDLVDELFLTIAPKIKLGRDVPTLADGNPLPRSHLLSFDLVSCQPVDNEIFLRYRRLAR
jgi:riboflavin biosynthesis pyrimidine reductase